MVLVETEIARLAEGETAPLSPIQERMWFLQEFLSRPYAYNSPIPFRVRGNLDRRGVGKAMAAVVERQEVLRTRFLRTDPVPVQVIDPAPEEFPVDFEDVPDLEAAVDRVREEGRKRVDLERGPVLRVILFRLGGRDDDHVLFFALHHASLDGWSCRLLVKEFEEAYGLWKSGRSPRLQPLVLRYRDVAVWQRRLLEDPEVRERVLGYWLRQLGGELPVLRLPADKVRPREFTYRGVIIRRSLPNQLTARVASLAARRRATVFSVYLAAYFAFLYRFTGQDDIVVGVPSFGRRHPDLESIVGVFVTTLPVRVRVEGDKPWSDLLTSVRNTLLDALGHDQIGFEQVLQELDVPRDPATTPVFQTLCHLIDFPPEEQPEDAELEIKRVAYDLGSSHVDLSMLFERVDGRIELRAQYNPDLFEELSVERWMAHFELLLERVCEDPGCVVDNLDLLGENDRRVLLEEWNQTERHWGEFREVAARVKEMAEEQPERTALRWRGRGMTYRELDESATRIARWLRHRDGGMLEREERVGVLMDRCPAMAAGLLGILRAGGAYLPLDPAYPAERMRFMLEDGGVRTLLVSDSTERIAAGLPARVLVLDPWEGCKGRVPELAGGEDAFPASQPGQLAYVLYTSGSTGRPKGVLIEHGALSNFIEQHLAETRLNADDRVAMLSTLTFDISTEELWPSLCAGACVCLCEEEVKLSPPRLLAWYCAENVTTTHLPTPYTELLLSEDWPEGCALRLLLTGGDKLHGYPQRRFPFRFLNTYGPTESTVTATCCEVATGTALEGAPPIGKPVANMRVYVLDRRMRPVPVGVCGELYLAGKSLARGYLNRQEETARRFVENPFASGVWGRMYATGDVVRWRNDGQIEFVGRADDQIQVRGHRVEPGEVEQVLREFPGVKEAAVLVRRNPAGEQRLVAYFELKEEGEANRASLERHVEARLPDYMLPGAWVEMKSWPRTPAGKLDRSKMPEPEWTARPGGGDGDVPQGNTECALAEIWESLLGVESVRRDDDFFAVGGESLKAMQLVSRIRKRWPVELGVRAVFEHRTVRGLSAYLETRCSDGVEAIEEGVL